MLKLFGLLFYISFFLFQGTLSADENTETAEIEEQIPMEEMGQKEVVIPEEAASEDSDTDTSNETQNMQDQTVEPEVTEQNDISEAQREADAAEAAELQEVGEGEEPVIE